MIDIYTDMANGLVETYSELTLLDKLERVSKSILIAKYVENIDPWVVSGLIEDAKARSYDSFYLFMVDELMRGASWVDDRWIRVISYLISGHHDQLSSIDGYRERVALIAINEARNILEALYRK